MGNVNLAQRKKRRSVVASCLCALVLLCFAVFALVPSTAWFGRTVVDKPYDDGEYMYTGTLKAGKFNGVGKIAFADGTRYEGGFYESCFHGEGTFFGEEWSFEGVFENGKPVSGILHGKEDILVGKDSYELKERWKYTGALGSRGQRGTGAFEFEDGAKYEGECVGGLAQGQGSYTGKDGKLIYKGGWHTGKYEGEGEYTAPDGSFSYKGAFRAGQFEGKGTVTVSGGKTVAGQWRNGWRVSK